MKDTKAILDIAYKECESKVSSNMSGYKKYLSKFINDRSRQLYSNAPTEQMYFTATDAEDFFTMTGINKAVITNAIEHTYYWEISNFNPSYAKDECTIAMLCLVRYFSLKKMQKELELAMICLSFSGKFYPSIFYRSFPVAPPKPHIMDYVVNNMCNNKYDIVREGNVIGAVKSISNTWLNTYTQKFKEFHDDDCVYLVQQLHNRIGSFMNNMAELYYEANENQAAYITYDSDNVSEDNYHLADSDVFKMERIVANTMNNLNTHGINYRVCKMASNKDVKMDELKSIIENIMANNNNVPLVKEYITLMVACYFKHGTKKDVRDLDFVTYSIKAKPNTKDKYIVRQKELINQILINNSEHFSRRRNREATESAYYRAINAYFAIMIQESNK